MDFEQTTNELLQFIDASPNAFFAVDRMKKQLLAEGFEALSEGARWTLTPGHAYFVTRNDSALIAFRIPDVTKNSTAGTTRPVHGFQLMASHCDSPAFKIKPNAEIEIEHYLKLNTEKYGGAILSPWLDRPLSVAGRVVVSTAQGIETRLVNIDRDLVIIPNLAIHMNREVNTGYKFNAQKDLLPLYGDSQDKGSFLTLIAEASGVSENDILDTDLFLYNRMKGTRIGASGEYIASGRLDDLQCAFASLQGFLQATPTKSIAVHCVFDNEEVGSGTRQGAAGTFLRDVLHRINAGLGGSEEDYLCAIANSFMVSADNAHAVHPNYADKTDPTNRPLLNKGIVIKYNANQKYTTDAVSGALFRKLCERADVPYQTFVNRSDMAGGSTLGNISQSQVSLHTVDIGLPQLSMHSSYETAGVQDTAYLIQAAKALFSTSLTQSDAHTITLS